MSKEISEVLGKPVVDPIPEETLKIRRFLLISAFLGNLYAYGEIEVSSVVTMGVGIEGITTATVSLGLLAVLVYGLIHFVWNCFDYIGLWRIHLSGTRLHHVTVGKFAADGADYPEDPTQSNLYYWWKQEAPRIGNIRQIAVDLAACAASMKEAAEKYEPLKGGGLDTHFFSRNASQIRDALSKLDSSVKHCTETLSSTRIPVSLDRFDRWFRLFKRSQVLRLLVVDVLLPVAFSVAAILGVIGRVASG